MNRYSRLSVEQLEARALPTSLGTPWASSQISISFVPDGTDLAGGESNLFASLDGQLSRDVWQKQVLSAFQSWAAVSNLSVGLTSDSGDPIGTAGRPQGDARFGDIRIAGADLGDQVVAVSMPPDPTLAGTQAGDIIINTRMKFGTVYNLSAVMLHEAGHSLGLEHSETPGSAMSEVYTSDNVSLEPEDVAAVQALYGVRLPDLIEGKLDNSAASMANSLRAENEGSATTLLTFGTLSDKRDKDVYSFFAPIPTESGAKIAVKLQTEGISFASAKLSIFYLNEKGIAITVSQSTMSPDQFRGGSILATFAAQQTSKPIQYFLKVESATKVTFPVGRYALAVSLDGTSLDKTNLLTLCDESPSVFINPDGNSNNTLSSATQLTINDSIAGGGRVEVLASLSTDCDVDFYRVNVPTDQTVLTLNVWVNAGQVVPEVSVFDSQGVLLSSTILTNATGRRTIQVAALPPGSELFVRIGGAVGNYHLSTAFGTVAATLQEFVSGEIVASTRTDTLYVGETQIFHFSLTASADNPPETGVRMTIRDVDGNVLLTLDAKSGQTISAEGSLLQPGEYDITFEAIRPEESTGAVSFALKGATLGDPIGVATKDPTLDSTERVPTDSGTDYLSYFGFSGFFWLPSLF